MRGGQTGTLTCVLPNHANRVINIQSVNVYGRGGTYCGKADKELVSEKCAGEKTCEVKASKGVFGGQCNFIKIKVDYSCDVPL